MLLWRMTYSLDLRQRVVSFVQAGGERKEASKIYSISIKTIYAWMHSTTLVPKKHGPRKRKIDRDALIRDIKQNPDALLRERAKLFNVHISAMIRYLKQMKIVKKNSDGTKKKVLWKELSS